MKRPDHELAMLALGDAIVALENAQTHLAGDNDRKWVERYKTVVVATSKARWVHAKMKKEWDALSVKPLERFLPAEPELPLVHDK